VPDQTNIEIGRLGFGGSIKVTKIAVTQDVKALVQKTALYDERADQRSDCG
jgi:hypothetical protein